MTHTTKSENVAAKCTLTGVADNQRQPVLPPAGLLANKLGTKLFKKRFLKLGNGWQLVNAVTLTRNYLPRLFVALFNFNFLNNAFVFAKPLVFFRPHFDAFHGEPFQRIAQRF